MFKYKNKTFWVLWSFGNIFDNVLNAFYCHISIKNFCSWNQRDGEVGNSSLSPLKKTIHKQPSTNKKIPLGELKSPFRLCSNTGVKNKEQPHAKYCWETGVAEMSGDS